MAGSACVENSASVAANSRPGRLFSTTDDDREARPASAVTSGPGTSKESLSVSSLCRRAIGSFACTLAKFSASRLATIPPNGARSVASARLASAAATAVSSPLTAARCAATSSSRAPARPLMSFCRFASSAASASFSLVRSPSSLAFAITLRSNSARERSSWAAAASASARTAATSASSAATSSARAPEVSARSWAFACASWLFSRAISASKSRVSSRAMTSPFSTLKAPRAGSSTIRPETRNESSTSRPGSTTAG